MTGEARFAKSWLAGGPLQHALGRLDMHAFDHLIAESLRSAAEGFDQRLCPLDLRRAGGKGPVARRYLVRMDQALAVEPEAAAFLRLANESIAIFKAVE